VYVETPALLKLSEKERNRRIDLLRLAESLGAEAVTLAGPTAAAALFEYAKTRRATRLLIGAAKRRGWRSWRRPSTTTEMVRLARDFDVMVVAPADRPEPEFSASSVTAAAYEMQPTRWSAYAWALVLTAVCTVVAWFMHPHFELANLVMIYLLGVTVAGLKAGRGPSVMAAVLSVAAFDFFFVPPQFTFAVSDAQYLVTFAVMLLVALTIANLMASVRQQTRVAGARERRTALLYAMSRELAATRGFESMARVAIRHVAEVFDAQAVVLLPDESGRLLVPPESAAALPESFRGADLAVAQWVLDHAHAAGLGTDTLAATPDRKSVV
jgi:two-component system sensor histidine kinase KdpD